MAARRTDLLGLSAAQFVSWSRGLVGFADRLHAKLYRHLMITGRLAPAELAEWRTAEAQRPGTIATLTAAAEIDQRPSVVRVHQAEDPEHGTTTKLVIRFADGREAETVVIPMRGGRRITVCVSSQIGCRMGCGFCRTARMGLVRDLAPHEIVGQVLAAAAHAGAIPRNVVFMGMGEPLDNLDHVAAALGVLTDMGGLALAARHITISTVGRVDRLPRLVELGLARFNLAISVMSARDEIRDRLMPVNRAQGLAALKQALLSHPLPAGRRLLIACVLIGGVNDAEADADALANWLVGLPALVNLIPFNAFADSPLQAPTVERVDAFRDRLLARGWHTRLRRTKGDAVLAACGQLGDGDRRQRAAVASELSGG